MSWLTAVKTGSTERAPAAFEEKMEWLCKFGEPSVSKMRNGWWARIDMNTNTTGSKFQVDTDTKHERPSQAVDQLIERMLDALTSLGVKP
jgi:hypothetical protein